MPTQLSLKKAAQVWTNPSCARTVVDPVLTEAFAEILDEIWSQAWLGNATTGELIEELKARCEINGTINYKTVNTETYPPEPYEPVSCHLPETDKFLKGNKSCDTVLAKIEELELLCRYFNGLEITCEVKDVVSTSGFHAPLFVSDSNLNSQLPQPFQ